MSALEVVNGHELIESPELGGFVCQRCGLHRGTAVAFDLTAAACVLAGAEKVRVVETFPEQLDSLGRPLTWVATAVLMGAHVHVTVRHGVDGQRANCGKLIVGSEQWPQLRSALQTLGEVKESGW